MKTLKQSLKQQVKKNLLSIINKYSSNAEEQREVYLMMQEILKEGLY